MKNLVSTQKTSFVLRIIGPCLAIEILGKIFLVLEKRGDKLKIPPRLLIQIMFRIKKMISKMHYQKDRKKVLIISMKKNKGVDFQTTSFRELNKAKLNTCHIIITKISSI